MVNCNTCAYHIPKMDGGYCGKKDNEHYMKCYPNGIDCDEHISASYTPDGWMLVKITGTDPHYRVFGSWAGGYLDGDSWRMNSGITKVTESETHYIIHGMSGSTYKVYKESYGRVTAYNAGVITDYCERSGGKMEIVEECPANIATDFDWII